MTRTTLASSTSLTSKRTSLQQDRRRLAQAKAGKQPQRPASRKSAPTLASMPTKHWKRSAARSANVCVSSTAAPPPAPPPTMHGPKPASSASNAARKPPNAKSSSSAPTRTHQPDLEQATRLASSQRRRHAHFLHPDSRSALRIALRSVNRDLFSKSYSFLPDMFKDELTTLKTTLAKLKKQESDKPDRVPSRNRR